MHPALLEWFRKNGSRAGKARAAKLTAAERSRIAKLAAKARWKKNDGDPQGPKGKQRPIREGVSGILLNSRRRPSRSANSLNFNLFEPSEANRLAA